MRLFAFVIVSLCLQPLFAAPIVTETLISADSLVLRGSNGAPNAAFDVLASTNVSLAKDQWPVINTHTFDSTGNFDCTNSINPAVATLYYQLRVNSSTGNPPDFSHVGFANAGFNVTGGEGGPVVTVTDGSQLSQYTDVNGPYTIYISGTLQMTEAQTHVRSHKTLIGTNNATLVGGGLYMHGGSAGLSASNIIIRNLTIINTADDVIGMTTRTRNVWIDHCTLVDGSDGVLDIVKGSDFVTVSWCKFYYTDNPPNPDHRFVNLVGDSDGAAGTDTDKLHVTFHHNWWSTNCIERMPSVRFGRAHIFNNYYSAQGNSYCVRTRINAECLVENNFFENVRNPWERYTGGTPGLLRASNNNVGYLDTTHGVTWGSGGSTVLIPGTDDVFTPPYSYTLDTAASVPAVVMQNAGAGKGPFAP